MAPSAPSPVQQISRAPQNGTDFTAGLPAAVTGVLDAQGSRAGSPLRTFHDVRPDTPAASAPPVAPRPARARPLPADSRYDHLPSIAVREEARRIRAAGRRLGAIMWAVVAMSLAFTCVNVTMFGLAHGVSAWIAWLLDPMASLALVAMLIGDGVLARHGVRIGGWSVVVKILAASATWAMNTWSSVVAADLPGILLHSVAPALVIALAEATRGSWSPSPTWPGLWTRPPTRTRPACSLTARRWTGSGRRPTKSATGIRSLCPSNPARAIADSSSTATSPVDRPRPGSPRQGRSIPRACLRTDPRPRKESGRGRRPTGPQRVDHPLDHGVHPRLDHPGDQGLDHPPAHRCSARRGSGWVARRLVRNSNSAWPCRRPLMPGVYQESRRPGRSGWRSGSDRRGPANCATS